MDAAEALDRIGSSTADAVAQVLETFCGSAVERSGVTVLPAGAPPLANIPLPAVVASVAYIDGVTGGNIFVMTRRAVQRLAAAMMGMDPEGVEEAEELGELELSAAGEAMNQMMAAAALATSSVLGEEVDIGPPETRFFATAKDAAEAFEQSPHATSVGFTVLGEPCRFVQLVPNAFVMRMNRALSELDAQAGDGRSAAEGEGIPEAAIRSVALRVSAELGRTRMPVANAVALPPGAVVELDRHPDEAVDLYVNGRRFGSGRLLLVDGEWAVRIDEVHPIDTPIATNL